MNVGWVSKLSLVMVFGGVGSCIAPKESSSLQTSSYQSLPEHIRFWLEHELTYNNASYAMIPKAYLEERGIVDVPFINKSMDHFEFQFHPLLLKDSAAAQSYLKQVGLYQKGMISFFRHPFLTATARLTYPFSRKENHSEAATGWFTKKGYLTASRSIAFYHQGALFSIKSGTDSLRDITSPPPWVTADKLPPWQNPASYPKGSADRAAVKKMIREFQKAYEPAKHNFTADAKEALAAGEWVATVDAVLGNQPKYQVVLNDLLAVRAKGYPQSPSDNYLIRDLSLIADHPEWRFLPAFALPFYPKAFGLKGEWTQEDFRSIFTDKVLELYAKPLARVIAEQLVRYGLIALSPNMQNFLIILDSAKGSINKLAVRDLADSAAYTPWFKELAPAISGGTATQPVIRKVYAYGRPHVRDLMRQLSFVSRDDRTSFDQDFAERLRQEGFENDMDELIQMEFAKELFFSICQQMVTYKAWSSATDLQSVTEEKYGYFGALFHKTFIKRMEETIPKHIEAAKTIFENRRKVRP